MPRHTTKPLDICGLIKWYNAFYVFIHVVNRQYNWHLEQQLENQNSEE